MSDMKLRTLSHRSAVMAYRGTVVALGLVFASCAVQLPAPTPPSPTAESSPKTAAELLRNLASQVVTEGGVTLFATADPARAVVGAPIDVSAVLTHDRAGPLIFLGSGSGIVFFSVTRKEDGLSSGPALMTLDCSRHEFARPRLSCRSSRAYCSGDPNAEFMQAYQQASELTLPAGTWRIDVATAGSLGEGCTGPRLDLQVSLTVVVTE